MLVVSIIPVNSVILIILVVRVIPKIPNVSMDENDFFDISDNVSAQERRVHV